MARTGFFFGGFMRILVYQHAPHEDPGSALDWMKTRGCSSQIVHLHAGEDCPAVSAADGLVLMGGPMNVYEEEKYPWLRSEKKSIAAFLDAGKPVLGICLGAQLIAAVLGAKVRKNKVKEIGWYPVRFSHTALEHPLFHGFPETAEVFQWHSDTFDIPAGAFSLGSSSCTQNQGFCFRDLAVGFQFHMECTAGNIQKFLAEDSGELRESSPYIMSRELIWKKAETHAASLNSLFGKFLDRFFKMEK
jgi:GMP synthase (glutamine-hydrolysing)